MKNRQLSKKIFVFILIWSCMTSAADYSYNKLKMQTFDEMLARVKKHVQTAESAGDEDSDSAKAELKEALQLIFSRPNSDNMVSQLVPTVRTPLRNLEAFDSSIDEIVSAALATLKDKKAKPSAKATAHIVLNNIMSEIKPDAKTNAAFGEIFKKIRDSKIKVTDDVKSEMRLGGSMKPPADPSEVAQRVIGDAK
jgi:endonuclease III